MCRAWSVWSSAAEAAFADAYQFAGGPVPDRGLADSDVNLFVADVVKSFDTVDRAFWIGC